MGLSRNYRLERAPSGTAKVAAPPDRTPKTQRESLGLRAWTWVRVASLDPRAPRIAVWTGPRQPEHRRPPTGEAGEPRPRLHVGEQAFRTASLPAELRQAPAPAGLGSRTPGRTALGPGRGQPRPAEPQGPAARRRSALWLRLASTLTHGVCPEG